MEHIACSQRMGVPQASRRVSGTTAYKLFRLQTASVTVNSNKLVRGGVSPHVFVRGLADL